MSHRLRAVFHRYATTHAKTSSGPHRIGEEGQPIGFVDRAEFAQGRVRIQGWAHAKEVTLTLPGLKITTQPQLLREDVQRATGLPAACGFELVLPASWQGLCDNPSPRLSVLRETGERLALDVPGMASRREHQRLKRRFLAALLRSTPAILWWRLTRSGKARATVKNTLGFVDPVVVDQPLDPRILDSAKPKDLPCPSDITVVLPVYNAFELLTEALDRLLRTTETDVRLILIEDCSTDPRIRPFLRDFARTHQGQGRITAIDVIENAVNLGFIGSVNAGFAMALEQGSKREAAGPILLLNSDAFLPDNWVGRLCAPLTSDPEIASTTPMSSDAEIFNVPQICRPSEFAPGQGDAIDAVAARFNLGSDWVEVPTGVGFCMAIARDWLKKVPQFDTVFGKGYGEEVDWCQSVRALGGRHVAVQNLFVEHRGGSSFGSAEKQARILQNGEIVTRRYPAFDTDVQNFIARDPLATSRLALGLAWAGSLRAQDPARPMVPVYLSHSLGGGADHYLEQKIAQELSPEAPGAAVVLRIGGARRWRIELISPMGRTTGSTDNFAIVAALLDILPERRLIYSCGVGDRAPHELPRLMASMHRAQDVLDVLFHDFLPISPSYTLLDSDGVYRGVPVAGRIDPAHRFVTGKGVQIPLSVWQEAWHVLAAKADHLTVFSEDSRTIVATVWPDLAPRIRVIAHSIIEPVAALPAPAEGAPPVIGVLGSIGQPKGAAVVAEIARRITAPANAGAADKRAQAPRPGLVLIGRIDPKYALPPEITVTGPYRPRDIGDLATHYGVTHWLIPSVWPETFSYTTHEAIATGLPVLAFDLGAQGTAVQSAPQGVAVPLGPDPAGNILAHFAAAGETNTNMRPSEALQTAQQSSKPMLSPTE